MKTRTLLYRDTTSNWASNNPILPDGMIGEEEQADDTWKQKRGDGKTRWQELPYIADNGASALVYGHESRTLTVAELRGTTITNIGQIAACDLQLPPADKDMNFKLVVGQASAFPWRLKADITNVIYSNGTPGDLGGYITTLAPALGDYLTLMSFKTSTGYDWISI